MYLVLVGDNDIDYIQAYGPYPDHQEAVAAETLFAESPACHSDDGEDMPRAVLVNSHQDLLDRIAEES